MDGFPIIDQMIFRESPRLAALLYLAVTGYLCKRRVDRDDSINKVGNRSAEDMRALIQRRARPYQNPGIRSEPDLLNRLMATRDSPLPTGNALLSFPLKVFDDLEALRAHLVATHRPGHWYRGQNTQHIAVYEGQIDVLKKFDPAALSRSPMQMYDPNWVALFIWRKVLSGSNPGMFDGLMDGLVALDPPGEVRLAFDSLMPMFFRAAGSQIPAKWTTTPNHDLPPLDYVSGAVRAIMNAPSGHPLRKLVLKYLEDVSRPALLAAVRRLGGLHIRDPAAEARALPYSNVQQSELDLISLSQHYGYGSVMVDITRSIDVALWFAAFKWDTDKPVGRESEQFGVVYRFDSDVIKPILRTNFGHDETRRSLVPHLGLFGMADISSMDPQIAGRPKAQQGGSLLGFENSVMHLLLAASPHVQAFAFPHCSVDGSETPLRKPDLCPENDPALAIFRQDETSKDLITPDELDRFLQQEDVDKKLRDQIVHQRSQRAI